MDSNIILYTTDSGNVSVQVQYEDGTFWLTQKRMAELFGVEVHTVNYHLKEIFQSGELQEDAVIRKIRITAADGKNYLTNFYHLDAIIAVGYRVNSKQATQFRIWATKTLNEFIVKGYVLDKERLIKGPSFGHDYFKELLIEIREIRASERRFYQKITDLYALAIDYDYARQGIGRQVVEFCKEEAKALGKGALRVDIVPDNEPAQNLYESCGFVNKGIYDLDRGFEFIPLFTLFEYVVK